MTWRDEAEQAWADRQADRATEAAREEQRRGVLLGSLLSDILGEEVQPTSSEFTSEGVTFALRRGAGGRDMVIMITLPDHEDEVGSLEAIGRFIETRGVPLPIGP